MKQYISFIFLLLLFPYCSTPTSSTLENNQSSPSATSIQNKDQTCQTFSEIAVMDDSLSESSKIIFDY